MIKVRLERGETLNVDTVRNGKKKKIDAQGYDRKQCKILEIM
jgi:hypothetical protein